MKHLILSLLPLLTPVWGLASAPALPEGYNCVACALWTDQAPALDGAVDAVWDRAQTYSIETFVPQPTNNTLVPPTDADDLSGLFRALWDDQNLYLLVEVRDQAMVLATDNYLEVYLSMAYTRLFGQWAMPGYCTDTCRDYQIAVRLWSGEIAWGLYSYKPDSHGFQVVLVPTANGYRAELSLPWADLDEAGLDRVWDEDRDYIGFDVHLQDDDDGAPRDTKLAWCGGPDGAKFDNNWADTSVWGTLRLARESCDPPSGCADSIFQTAPFYDLGGCWKWNFAAGYVYDAHWPFVYLHQSSTWAYIFAAGASLEAGFYYYDFSASRFGWSYAEWLDGDGQDDLGLVFLP